MTGSRGPWGTRGSEWAGLTLELPRTTGLEGLLVLAAIAAYRWMADDPAVAQVSGDGVDRLTIHLAETVDTIAGLSRETTEEGPEQIRHVQRDSVVTDPPRASRSWSANASRSASHTS